MVHGYLESYQKDLAKIYSAGIETHGLNENAVAIMKEDGVDISHHSSNHVDEYKDIEWDFIITVCDHAKEHCPIIPSKNAQRIHHNFKDPSKVQGTEAEIHEAFLKTREDVKEFCETFIKEELVN
jgi:arsenate reductase